MADQPSASQADVLVIGGGPAGLALGFELQRRHVSFLILERGPTVGESWRRMPTSLKLVSPWKANCLAGTQRNLFPRNHQLTRAEFFAYLQRYARDQALPVRTGVEVFNVGKTKDSFLLQTSQGDFTSHMVVNATGYFSNPYIPEIAGARASSIPQRHVADYGDPENARRIMHGRQGMVLLVGKRLSAGQTMVELAAAGFEVALSHQTPIAFGAGPLAWWFLFRVFPWLEWLRLKWLGSKAPGNDVRMEGGMARKLIEGGTVKTFPGIRCFEERTVVFENGAHLRPDLVIYATGFRPALRHLQSLHLSSACGRPDLRNLESASMPGLFFIGLDQGRNFQSRFLRGIRNDVVFLAERLQQRLDLQGSASSPAQQPMLGSPG